MVYPWSFICIANYAFYSYPIKTCDRRKIGMKSHIHILYSRVHVTSLENQQMLMLRKDTAQIDGHRLFL